MADWQRLDYAHYARYDQYLPSWLGAFGRDNVLVAQAEEVRTNASALFERVQRFLHLRVHRVDVQHAQRLSNAKQYAQFYTLAQYRWMVQQFEPVAERVRQQLGAERDFGWPRIWAHVLERCEKSAATSSGGASGGGDASAVRALSVDEAAAPRSGSLWEGAERPRGCDPSDFPVHELFPPTHFPPTPSAATPCATVHVEDPWHDNFGPCSIKDY